MSFAFDKTTGGWVRRGLYLLGAIFFLSFVWLPYELIFSRATSDAAARIGAIERTVIDALWIVGASMLLGARRLVAATRGGEARRLGVASAALLGAAIVHFAPTLAELALGRALVSDDMFSAFGFVLALVAAALAGALFWWLRTAEEALDAPPAPRGLYFAGAAGAGTSVLCQVIVSAYPRDFAPASIRALAPLGWTAALGCAAALALRLARRSPALLRRAERRDWSAERDAATGAPGDAARLAPKRKSFPARLLEFVVGFFAFQSGAALIFAGVTSLAASASWAAIFIVGGAAVAAFVILVRKGRTAAAMGGLASLVIVPLILVGACLAMFRP